MDKLKNGGVEVDGGVVVAVGSDSGSGSGISSGGGWTTRRIGCRWSSYVFVGRKVGGGSQVVCGRVAAASLTWSIECVVVECLVGGSM